MILNLERPETVTWTDAVSFRVSGDLSGQRGLSVATEEAFHLRFLAQSAVPVTQMTTVGDVVHLVDVVTGSAATLTPHDGGWQVREASPVRLWERIERVLDAYDEADRPGPATFTLHVYDGGQHLRHPQMPGLPLPRLF